MYHLLFFIILGYSNITLKKNQVYIFSCDLVKNIIFYGGYFLWENYQPKQKKSIIYSKSEHANKTTAELTASIQEKK